MARGFNVQLLLDRVYREGAAPGDPVEAMIDASRTLERVLSRAQGKEEVYSILSESAQYFSATLREYGALATLALVTRRVAETLSRDPRLGDLPGRVVGSCVSRGVAAYLSDALQRVFEYCRENPPPEALFAPHGAVAFSCYLGARAAGARVYLASYARPPELEEEREYARMDIIFADAEAPRLPWYYAYQRIEAGARPVMQANIVAPTGALLPPGGEEMLLVSRRSGTRPLVVTLRAALSVAGILPGEHLLPRTRVRTPWSQVEEYPALEAAPARLLRGAQLLVETGPLAYTPLKIRGAARSIVEQLEEVILRSCRQYSSLR